MTGFADRFSDSQRAALAALGYAVLERSTQPGSRLAPLPQASPAPSHGAAPRPSAVLIEGMDGSGLARGVLAAAIAAAGEPRVVQRGEGLKIVLDGDGDAWRLSLQRLRRSPRDKAALWRALRTLRRSTR